MNKWGSFGVSDPIRVKMLKEVMIFEGDSVVGIQGRMFF